MIGRYKRLFRSCLVVLTALLVSFGSTLSTYAKLDKNTLKIYADNNIIYYDPTASTCIPQTSTKPTGDQITWIGDSYTFFAENVYHLISSAAPGTDIHGLSGCSFYNDGDGYPQPSGLTLLRELKENGTLRKNIVYALGANDVTLERPGGGTYIDELEEITGPDYSITLVTLRTRDFAYDAMNKQILASADTYSNIRVADWRSAVEKAGLDKYFAGEDNGSGSTVYIHPNEAGYKLWVDTILGNMPGTVGLVEGDTVEDMVWNYFVSANIPGLSDNAAAIAGIMGNFKQESGMDPFVWSGLWGEGSIYADPKQTATYKMLESSGLLQYNGKLNSAPKEAIAQAVKMELDFFVANKDLVTGKTFHGFGYVENLGKVAKPSAGSYAELFQVTIERNYLSNEPAYSQYWNANSLITDTGVAALAYSMGGDISPSKPLYYGQAAVRRAAAEKYYAQFATASNITTGGYGDQDSSGIAWESDGWIVPGSIPGATVQDAHTLAEQTITSGHQSPGGLPNKILLHSTEGHQNGLNAYSTGNFFPPHFTIDVKTKSIAQHYSLWEPSTATMAADLAGTIQIEIVGSSTNPNDSYYLPNFTADEWDYLATLMGAISSAVEQQGGHLPLESTLNWSHPTRMTQQELNDYSGVMGHTHSPSPDDHTDPGDIWQYLEAAIARNPVAAQFSTGSNITTCEDGNGLISGGMTMEQAEAFMKEYYNLAVQYSDANGGSQYRGKVISLDLDGRAVSVYHADYACSESGLANCASFSQYFINRYTDLGPNLSAANGGLFVRNILEPAGFETGSEPRVYSIFSQPGGEWGHTGVILGIEGDNLIIGEASCVSHNGLSQIGVRTMTKSAAAAAGMTYGYLSGHLIGI